MTVETRITEAGITEAGIAEAGPRRPSEQGSVPVSAPGEARVRLIRAAEVLFAERGLDGVSLREITAAADVGNSSAIQYHFGDRSGLVRAVLAKHHPAVEARRHALLDQYEADGAEELRTLTGALVRPLAAELDNSDGGAGYLQVMSELASAPRPVLSSASIEDPGDSTYRWRALVEPLLTPEAVRLHRRFTAVQFTLTELARRGRDERVRDDRPPDDLGGGASTRTTPTRNAPTRTAPSRDDRLFTSHLVDLVTALLAAPVSEETLRLARCRAARTRTS